MSLNSDMITQSIILSPKYEIGDILQIKSTGAFFLIEDIVGYEYYFRILDCDSTRRDSIFYIDQHTNIIKIA